MSEERTQPASKRRQQLARQRGQVAHSPELTAAIGWTVAVATLGALSDKLISGLTSLIDRAMAAPAVVSVDQIAVVAQIREQVAVVIWPLLDSLGLIRDWRARRSPGSSARLVGDSASRSRSRASLGAWARPTLLCLG